MAHYRKKPVEIEAFRIGVDRMPEWFRDKISDGAITFNDVAHTSCSIVTLEGTMIADYRDWIIKGIKGELYPCKPDIFDATYEETEFGGAE